MYTQAQMWCFQLNLNFVLNILLLFFSNGCLLYVHKTSKSFFFSNYFPNLEIIVVWERNNALNVLANQCDTSCFLFRLSYKAVSFNSRLRTLRILHILQRMQPPEDSTSGGRSLLDETAWILERCHNPAQQMLCEPNGSVRTYSMVNDIKWTVRCVSFKFKHQWTSECILFQSYKNFNIFQV